VVEWRRGGDGDRNLVDALHRDGSAATACPRVLRLANAVGFYAGGCIRHSGALDSKAQWTQSAASDWLQGSRALGKGVKKRIGMLGENLRCEKLLASEVVIERAFRDADGRGYVPNADAQRRQFGVA
jgi:hypothetical protein